jgi:Protein of unknown function (DUF2752)
MTRARGLARGVPRRARVFLAVALAVLAVTAWRGASFCPFALVTGIPCPGCGLGRATIALMTGHPVEAFHFHPLVFVALPALAGFAWSMARSRALGVPSQRLANLAAAALLGAVIGVWVARFEGAFGGPVKVLSARAALAALTR